MYHLFWSSFNIIWSSFINNDAGTSATDIYYKYKECDESGTVTFTNNFFKKSAGTTGNLISFDSNSPFDFNKNTISIAVGSGGDKVFSWRNDISESF